MWSFERLGRSLGEEERESEGPFLVLKKAFGDLGACSLLITGDLCPTVHPLFLSGAGDVEEDDEEPEAEERGEWERGESGPSGTEGDDGGETSVAMVLTPPPVDLFETSLSRSRPTASFMMDRQVFSMMT